MFGGAKNFCPNFPKLAIFGSLSVHEDGISDDFQKRSSFDFVWVTFFSNQSTLSTIFAHISMDFAQIIRDFVWISTKSKLLWVLLHPCLLHHW